MELTDNDRQRIEQEIDRINKDKLYVMQMSAVEKAYFRLGAEYCTIYEREQQAPLLRELEEFKNGNLMDEYTVELSEKVKQLEAERSELRNKVIEEVIAGLKKIGYGGQGFEYNDSSIFDFLNSLKK